MDTGSPEPLDQYRVMGSATADLGRTWQAVVLLAPRVDDMGDAGAGVTRGMGRDDDERRKARQSRPWTARYWAGV
jgi:hypothetical protein